MKLIGIETCACDCPELIPSSTVPTSLSGNDSPTFEVRHSQARPNHDRASFRTHLFDLPERDERFEPGELAELRRCGDVQ